MASMSTGLALRLLSTPSLPGTGLESTALGRHLAAPVKEGGAGGSSAGAGGSRRAAGTESSVETSGEYARKVGSAKSPRRKLSMSCMSSWAWLLGTRPRLEQKAVHSLWHCCRLLKMPRSRCVERMTWSSEVCTASSVRLAAFCTPASAVPGSLTTGAAPVERVSTSTFAVPGSSRSVWQQAFLERRVEQAASLKEGGSVCEGLLRICL
mmetsp:Transcript_91160/g.294885  ORF Transcript_91160/g.294885 Transcript_91160/m.294885 type:complete len:209 (+) Transcript_91160:176-802(+)